MGENNVIVLKICQRILRTSTEKGKRVRLYLCRLAFSGFKLLQTQKFTY